MPNPGKKSNEELLEEQMQNYATQTVGPLLESTFSATDDPECGHQAERGDHIIIDGKTGREIVMEEFSKQFWQKMGGPNPQFPKQAAVYYQKNAKVIINKKVAEALMTGKRVEVFVPDPKTGRIKQEPSKLTNSGYQMSDPLVKPRQLSRWKRFWSKLGFYKTEATEYATKQAEYERNMNAREQVKFYNKISRITTNDLRGRFPDMLEAWYKKYPERRNVNLNVGHGTFRLSRQSYIAAVTAILARKKDANGNFLYSNDELFDMNSPKMIKARTEAAEEYFQRSEKRDTKWQAELFKDSATCLTERMNAQSRTVDFSDRNMTETKEYQTLYVLSRTCFELSQDVSSLQEHMTPEDYSSVNASLADMPNIMEKITDGLRAEKELVNGMAGDKESDVAKAFGRVFAGQVVRQHFAQQMKEHPEKTFMDLSKDGNAMLVFSTLDVVAANDDYQLPVSDKMEHQRIYDEAKKLEAVYKENPKEIADQILSGVLDQRIKLKSFSSEKAYNAVEIDVSTPRQAERELKQIKAQEQHKAQQTNAQVLT